MCTNLSHRNAAFRPSDLEVLEIKRPLRATAGLQGLELDVWVAAQTTTETLREIPKVNLFVQACANNGQTSVSGAEPSGKLGLEEGPRLQSWFAEGIGEDCCFRFSNS